VCLCVERFVLHSLPAFPITLYANAQRYAVRVVSGGYGIFLIGVLLSYYLIFPLTFRFLGDLSGQRRSREYDYAGFVYFDIDDDVPCAGDCFRDSDLCWLFAKLDFLSAEFMRCYRKHSIVMILVVAAIITPTSDIFTLSLVVLLMWILYEVSILIVSKVEKFEKQ
jgi:hypothetical protein